MPPQLKINYMLKTIFQDVTTFIDNASSIILIIFIILNFFEKYMMKA